MAGRLVTLRLLVSTVWGAAASGQVMWQPLEHAAQPMQTFDHTVLGNLANANGLAEMRVPRSHAFVTTISVGTPPQPLRCLLDSAFADLWLPSKRCPHGVTNCANTAFLSDQSSSFMPAMEQTQRQGLKPLPPVRVPYGDGDVEGFMAQDTVSFGTGTFKNQSFLLLGDVALPPRRDWDGICGLGWYQIATAGKPLYTQIAAASHGGNAIFSFVPGPNKQSYLVVGQVPETACKPGTLAWAETESITSHGQRSFWLATGGLAIHQNKPVKSRFLLDTGTEFILAPPNKYGLFIRSLFPLDVFDHMCGMDHAAGNLVVCNCAILDSKRLLPLRLYLGGREFVMEIADLFKKVPSTDGGEMCLLQIQQNTLAMADPLDLLGDLLGGGRQPERHASPVSVGRTEEVDLTQGVPPFNAAKTSVWLPGADITPITGRRLQDVVKLPEAFTNSPNVKDDLVNDLWVIGGVFLKRFVTILDFEGGRMGFAEPADTIVMPSNVKVAPSLATTFAPVAPQAVAVGSITSIADPNLKPDMRSHITQSLGNDPTEPTNAAGQHPASSWGMACMGIVLVLGAAGPAWFLRQTSRRKNAGMETFEDVEEGEGVVEAAAVDEDGDPAAE